MLNTYIKNRGITKTIIHDNNHNHTNQINWDADYDGDVANISFNTNTDGKRNHFNISLDNEDLANILNMPSVNIPIDKRLKMDFEEPYYRSDPYKLEVPTPDFEPIKPEYIEEIDRRITTPLTGEELIIPLTIDEKGKNLFTMPHKKHRRPKTHLTHRVYKKLKSKSKSKSKSTLKSKTKSRSSRRKTIPIIDLL